MKQFIISLAISILFYILASIIGLSFNPMDWNNEVGRLMFGLFFMFIWLLPIMLNYLNGDKNFKNK